MTAAEPHVRDVLDRFYTPPRLAVACVAALDIPDPSLVVEPSIGEGAFALAVKARWPSAHLIGVDIDPNASGFQRGDVRIVRDWPTHAPTLRDSRVDLVAGNPPYSEAEAHVRAALSVAPVVGMLLRLAFLEGRERGDGFWKQHPPSVVHVLSRRPSFTSNGRTDAAAYGFFVWDERHVGAPELRWLDWSPR